MAAARDPATGKLWGGVLLQGGRLDLALNGRIGSIYAFGEGGRLIGLRVLDNTRFAGGGGAELSIGAGIGGGFELGLSGAMQRAPEFREMRAAIILRAGGL